MLFVHRNSSDNVLLCILFLQFDGDQLWNVASAGQDVNKAIVSTEIVFDKPDENTSTMKPVFQYRKSSKYVTLY